MEETSYWLIIGEENSDDSLGIGHRLLLEKPDKCCYLGYMLGANVHTHNIQHRWKELTVAWKKLNECLAVLTGI